MKSFFIFFLGLTLGKAQQLEECIPIQDLRDAMVERGLGEARTILKVRLYFIGEGNIDVSVGVAARFLREDFRKPLIAKCGEYVGPADNAMVSISCIQANDDGEEKALSGLAVYAKFNEKNLTNPSVSICRMEIVLQKQYDSEESGKMSGIVFTLIGFSLVIVVFAALVVFTWIRRRNKEDNFTEGVLVDREHDVVVRKSIAKTLSVRSEPTYDEDDEVFLK